MTTCEDTAAFTAKTLDDPRTLNKRLHIRVPSNYLSQREMIAIWERLSGHRVKTYEMSEKETDESADGALPTLRIWGLPSPATLESHSGCSTHIYFVRACSG